MADPRTWAACVEGAEEDGYQAGATRAEAIAAAMEYVVEDVECGWNGAGERVLSVLSGCIWHDRCDDGSCEYCPSDDRWDFWLESSAKSETVTVEVYATGEDEDGPCDFEWREVSDG